MVKLHFIVASAIFLVSASFANSYLIDTSKYPGATDELGSLVDLDTEGVCDALDIAFGYDVCGSIGEASSASSAHAPSRSPSPRSSTPQSSPMSSSGSDICSSYNFDNPAGYDDVVNYLRYSLQVAPVKCFKDFIRVCDWELDSQQEWIEAFANWTTNYQTLYEYLQSSEPGLVSPDCLSILPPDLQLQVLTGFQGGNAEACDYLPDFDETTPLAVDWDALGAVTPVTEQFGGTCYVHATVGWFGSQALLQGLKDESGKNQLTNATTLSVQPLLDCMNPGTPSEGTPCEGGLPQNVSRLLAEFGTTETSRYPYMSETFMQQNKLPSSACFNPDNPACPRLDSNATLLYKLPQSMSQLTECRLSESQLARFLADRGPVVVGYAAGNLGSNWEPYLDAEKMIKAPWEGRMGEGNMSYCAEEGANHVVLMTGYEMRGDTPYFIYRNSWGTRVGLDGFFWVKMSDRDSPAFTNRNYTGQCEITGHVFVWPEAESVAVTNATATQG